MARSEVESRVAAAMAALTKDKKTTVRDLAKAIDQVSSCTVKVAKINTERDQAIKSALEALDAAKAAGWTAADLQSAGLTVPRPITIELPPEAAAPEPAKPRAIASDEPRGENSRPEQAAS